MFLQVPVCPRGGGVHAWQGCVQGKTCVAGGMHCRGGGTCMAGETATEAGGTQPTKMHSCEQDQSNLSKQTHSEM